MAVAVAVAVSGSVAVPVAVLVPVPVAGLIKRFFNQKHFLITVGVYFFQMPKDLFTVIKIIYIINMWNLTLGER